MNGNIRNPRTLLYLISAVVLLGGLAGAALLYRAAPDDADDASGYEVVGGFVYPGAAEHSKKYEHELQLYGGKAAVLADDFMRWFAGLWRGKSLAYSVACIAAVVSFVLFVAARNAPSRSRSDNR